MAATEIPLCSEIWQMTTTKTRLILSLLIGLALAGTGLVGLVYIISVSQLPGEIRAQGLPDLQVTRLDGTAVYLQDLRGKPMIVNFWATWCPPCVEEMPALEKLHQALSGEVNVVAVNLGEDPEVVKAYLDQHDLVLPVLLDEAAQVAHVLGINYLPATLFVDAKGVVRSSYRGALTAEQMGQGAATLQRRFSQP
jgi:thiol-disulfide isomerase/thioredoxin